MRIVAALSVMLVGCSSSGAKVDGGSDGAAAPGDMSRQTTMLEPNPSLRGLVDVIGYDASGATVHTTISASFSMGDGKAGPCSLSTIGACTLRSCPRSDAGTIAIPVRTSVGAGTIDFSGVGPPVTLTRDSNNLYSADLAGTWTAGAMLDVQSTAEVVPAFLLALVAPGRASILTPAAPSGNQPLTVTRAAGLALTWTPVTPGTLAIQLADSGSLTLTCTAAGDAGAFTVPPAALELLPPNGLQLTAAMKMESSSMAGAWPIAIDATESAVDSNGNAFGRVLILN